MQGGHTDRRDPVGPPQDLQQHLLLPFARHQPMDGQHHGRRNNSVNSVGTFGKYTKTLSTPRVMQFSLRYAF